MTSRYQRAFEYADLRHEQGYALRLQGITTGTAPAPAARK
jgi:cell division protein FtsQ